MADDQIPIMLGLTWGENPKRSTSDRTHIEWHAPCGCAFHPNPFPHIHPCSDEHKRPDLHGGEVVWNEAIQVADSVLAESSATGHELRIDVRHALEAMRDQNRRV